MPRSRRDQDGRECSRPRGSSAAAVWPGRGGGGRPGRQGDPRGTATASMTSSVAIIDTNVVVSGLLAGHSASPPAVILDGMLRARFTYLLSLEVLAEYREVLLRPRIQRRHGL